MRQNPQNRKTKIEAKPESIIQVKLPMVRDYSTGGGHLPGDELVEGDDRIVTKKWQGYPPQNLNVVGHSMPPLPEVSIPRFTGKAEYASRVWFPNMLYAKFLTCPHPHARIRRLDTSKAEQMPGVAYVLTYRNAPNRSPLPQELSLTGEVVAIVAADTEDLAEDAVEAIEVDYEVLPAAPTLEAAMAPGAPDLREGRRGNLIRIAEGDPHYDPNATWTAHRGDVEQGFREADLIREFTYYWAGATAIPMQPAGSVAKWEGDRLTFWGMSQGIYPLRDSLARNLGMDPAKVRFINKYNGCTFSAARGATEPFYVYIAHIAKMTGRPTKVMLPKDQEMAFVYVKPENMTKFKVGTKNGRIIALQHEVYISAGEQEQIGQAENEIAKNNFELYTARVPNWKTTAYAYKSNAMRTSPVRSYTQQEIKWAFENMIDEMAEAVGIDPVQFRLMHVSKPGDKLTGEWHKDLAPGARYENQNGEVTYDSFGSVEVLEEGAKVIGWERRNPVPGGNPGRFKRGFGVANSQHHAGHMGYHDGEEGFRRRMQETQGTGGGGGGGLFGAEVELTADGYVTIKNALPDSGTNHDTALAHVVAEILGFTSRNYIRPLWGDSAITPPSNGWIAGKTITVQGAALYSAADKLRKDLLNRAARTLNVDAATLQIRDGVISSRTDPRKRTTFAALARANGGSIRKRGQGVNKNQGRALTKGVGACFMEVEVDTWTGNFRIVRAAYCHDTGLVVNPLVAAADMQGSLNESIQMATDPVPYDREFPGHRHYSVGYLSYRLPTIMDVPEQTQVFVDSLEPRWFFGIKSFSETSIGCVPGALSNAIYNACGVRIRETPITREKILAGLKAKGVKS